MSEGPRRPLEDSNDGFEVRRGASWDCLGLSCLSLGELVENNFVCCLDEAPILVYRNAACCTYYRVKIYALHPPGFPLTLYAHGSGCRNRSYIVRVEMFVKRAVCRSWLLTISLVLRFVLKSVVPAKLDDVRVELLHFSFLYKFASLHFDLSGILHVGLSVICYPYLEDDVTNRAVCRTHSRTHAVYG